MALLNGAGPFADQVTPPREGGPTWWDNTLAKVKRVGKKVVMQFAFIRAKQPARIEEVLKMVYAKPDNVDADLVTSIVVSEQTNRWHLIRTGYAYVRGNLTACVCCYLTAAFEAYNCMV